LPLEASSLPVEGSSSEDVLASSSGGVPSPELRRSLWRRATVPQQQRSNLIPVRTPTMQILAFRTAAVNLTPSDNGWLFSVRACRHSVSQVREVARRKLRQQIKHAKLPLSTNLKQKGGCGERNIIDGSLLFNNLLSECYRGL
jgi:hypothetical protein